MSASIQLQWSFAPPAGRPITLADIILTRVLERYGLHTPSRTTLQLRTYRASLPASSNESNSGGTSTRYLTLVTTLSTPPQPPISSSSSNDGRDDTAYIFLDDRDGGSSSSSSAQQGQNGTDVNDISGDQPTPELTPMKIDRSESATPAPATTPAAGVVNGGNIDDDGFEIIDVSSAKDAAVTGSAVAPNPTANTTTSTEGQTGVNPAASQNGDGQKAIQSKSPQQRQLQQESSERQPQNISRSPRRRYRILPVRPGHAVVPMLQSLLSPFVLGLTKSARATASTTNSTPVPTPLPGISLLLTVLSFTYTPSFTPTSNSESDSDTSITLRIYILPNPTAQSIFLEAEYATVPDIDNRIEPSPIQGDEDALKEFLEGCLPAGVGGLKRFSRASLPDPHSASEDSELDSSSITLRCEGWERTTRSVYTLTKTLREGGFVW